MIPRDGIHDCLRKEYRRNIGGDKKEYVKEDRKNYRKEDRKDRKEYREEYRGDILGI